jgi:phage-related holin
MDGETMQGSTAQAGKFDIEALKWLTSACAAVWAPLPLAVQILTIVCVANLCTVILNPVRSLGRETKRVSIILILTFTVCFLSDLAKMRVGFNVGFDICAAVAFFYSISLAVRIMQNVNAAGVPLPPVMLDLLSKAEGLTGSELEDIDELRVKQTTNTVSTLTVVQSQQTETPVRQEVEL